MTACILCSINCGIEVQVGGEHGRHIIKVRGDDAHPASRGYVCEKSQRMDHYQNGADRLTSPLRRRPDGSYEAITWDVAIHEIADRFKAIKAKYGGESILYYGGGGQGNHLGGTYADSFLKAVGNQFRSNALAQEKTGEFWVQGKMLGTGMHGDFEHCEVAVFIGKNPWQSHGFARARVALRDIQKDPQRALIVIDPRRSETAEMADYHLAIRPGTDAWCLAALPFCQVARVRDPAAFPLDAAATLHRDRQVSRPAHLAHARHRAGASRFSARISADQPEPHNSHTMDLPLAAGHSPRSRAHPSPPPMSAVLRETGACQRRPYARCAIEVHPRVAVGINPGTTRPSAPGNSTPRAAVMVGATSRIETSSSSPPGAMPGPAAISRPPDRCSPVRW